MIAASPPDSGKGEEAVALGPIAVRIQTEETMYFQE